MGKAGLGKVSVVQWMQHANSDFFSFFPSRYPISLYLSLSLSLSPQPRKKKQNKQQQQKNNKKTTTTTTTTTKKKRVYTHAKFLCIFLKDARTLRPPPASPPHTSPHTNGNSFKSLNTSLSSRWWWWGWVCVCGGG